MSKTGKKAIAYILYYLGLILTGAFAGLGLGLAITAIDEEDD